MQMSKAALPPIQPRISEEDRKHSLFSEYERWRASMSMQLVRADAFPDWLRQRAHKEEADRILAHPRWKEWVVWLRENVNCKPQKHHWLSPWDWEAKFGGK